MWLNMGGLILHCSVLESKGKQKWIKNCNDSLGLLAFLFIWSVLHKHKWLQNMQSTKSCSVIRCQSCNFVTHTFLREHQKTEADSYRAVFILPMEVLWACLDNKQIVVKKRISFRSGSISAFRMKLDELRTKMNTPGANRRSGSKGLVWNHCLNIYM